MPLVILLILMTPVLELIVLINVGSQLGALSTIGLTLLTAVVGLSLVRSQGLQVLKNARHEIAEGQVAAPVVIEGALLAMAGMMLLFPGFMTDTLGALLLISPLRRAMAQRAVNSPNLQVFNQNRFQGGFHAQQGENPFQQHNPFKASDEHNEIIDGEFEEVDEARKKLDQERKNFD